MTEPLDYWALSRAFRGALLGYDLRPNEFRLGQVLCSETYDAGRVRAPVRLAAWAGWLDLRDAKSLRPDKCAALLTTLHELGVVAVSQAQGTFEPRPDAELWSRARAFRARAVAGDAAELPLQCEPLLAEALSEVAREKALAGAQRGPVLASAKSADGVGEIRRRGTYIHDHVHGRVHESHIMPHAKGGFLAEEFEVGALGKKSAREIFEAVAAVCPRLTVEHREAWLRRIEENAPLVWSLAREARERTDLGNPPGWLNRAYLREMGLHDER